MGFRKDINGLRAIAVLGVLFFHFNPGWLPGGFAGVDVFFVISGFLMTSIIFKGIDESSCGGGHSFNLWKFYQARALRIAPALCVLCLVSLGFGWLFLVPSDYRELAKHSAGSVSFVSNFIYWQEAGYFDTTSHQKWLLHTWSLSVEWQFYLVFPVVLLVLRRFLSLEAVRLILLSGALFGFCFGAWFTYKDAEAAYYLLPSRAWQMLLGGAAYLYPFTLSSSFKRVLELAGLLLILGVYFFVYSDDAWPGYLALLPAFGAFLIIQSQIPSSLLTGNLVFQKIGLWSYSIYLWHWPIVVANLKFDLGIGVFSYLAISVMCGAVSYYLFERKSRRILFFAFFTSLACSVFIYYTNGAESRVDKKYQLSRTDFHAQYYGGSGYSANRFFFLNGSVADYDYVFMGDSYGLQYAKSMDEDGLKVAGLFDHGCLIFPTVSRYRNNREDQSCSVEYDALKGLLSKSDKPLIMASSWDTYRNNLINKGEKNKLDLSQDDYKSLIKSELDLIVDENGTQRDYFLVGVPQRAGVNVFECLAGTQLIGYRFFKGCVNEQDAVELPVNNFLREWAASRSNTHFIDPNEFLCESGKCLIVINREPVHSDGSHLSVFGAKRVSRGIFDFVKNTISN